jgi:superfamily II DNA or RNA helicase
MFNNLPYAQQVGFSYEYYVLEQISKDYDKVWHWKDFPEKLMYENNLIDDYDIFSKYRYDIGADLVALKDNKYYFIQCKNFNNTILMENLAGFYFLLYEYNLTGILYYSGTLSQRVKDLSRNKIKFINLPYNNLNINLIKNIETPIIRDYQKEAYNKLLNKSSSILSLPCGMGKTYTASLLAKNYDNIIILSPLRYLAYQTLECFKQYLGETYSPILVSHDGKRNIDDINHFIKDKNIISSTYDSADIVVQLITKLQNIYIIIDEFHNLSHNNITEPINNVNKLINYNCDKIYLSATPIKNFMNITNIYCYSWPDAIKNKYICDFTIYIPDQNETYQKFVDFIHTTCDKTIDSTLIKKAYFMLKSMLYNGDKKCICYMTSIELANNMCNILIWLSKLLNIEIEYWQIDSTTKKTIREKIIDEYKNTNKTAIIVNVHILDEGINIPECDSVFITRPNDNMINIIQRMCRANRILNNKTNCNIYLWCKEEKTRIILDYIYNNTNGFIKDKVYIHNTETKNIQKHEIETIVQQNNIDIIDKSDSDIVSENSSGDDKSIKCDICHATFARKQNLKLHLARKYSCNNLHLNKTCNKCNKVFSTVQAYKHHIDGRCKKKIIEPEEEPEEPPEEEQKKKIEEELKDEILELKKSMMLLSDKINNQISPNNNIIHITINPVEKPNMFITDDIIKTILNKGSKSVPELITRLYFDKEHPENHNVYISNKRDFRLSYFNGKEWILSNNNDILDMLYNSNCEYLIRKFEELEGQLDASTLLEFSRFKKNKDKKFTMTCNKYDIKFILYNKKDIVLDTKKNI